MAEQLFEEEALAEEIADIIRQDVAAATKPLRDRIAELQRFVKELARGRWLGLAARGIRYVHMSLREKPRAT